MYQLNFDIPLKVHFIGIGGISMSGLARILLDHKFIITGSDVRESAITRQLEGLGIPITYEQSAENITPDTNLVVYTAAIHPDNPEYAQAVRLGVPMLDRASLLGQIMKLYEKSIAVAGTHGKTTTTSMLSHILLAADCDPTISVGGILKAIGGNLRIGRSDYFLTEACEYTNSFLRFYPKVEIILNIEADHLDFFEDLSDIRRSFRAFAQKLPANGTLIISRDIDNLQEITQHLSCRILTFGLNADCDFAAQNINFDEKAHPCFDLYIHGSFAASVTLGVCGLHNVTNALAAAAAATALKLPLPAITGGLGSYQGTDRRFEYKGTFGGTTVIDDYAHHPTEIAATLTTAQHYPHRKLWCVFQPHTYSRTKAFLKDFAHALALADSIVLADIYAARENPPGDIHSEDIRDLLRAAGKEVWYFPTFAQIEDFLLQNCAEGDLVLTMGAGDILKVGEELLARAHARQE